MMTMVANATSAALTPSMLKFASRCFRSADQKAQPENPVQNDHHRREYGVARQGRRFLTAREHQGHDEGDLDEGDRERQHQGAVRLADAVCDHLGVMDRGEHAGRQSGGDDGDENSAGGHAQQCRQQDCHGKRGGGDRPHGNLRTGFHWRSGILAGIV